MTSSRTVQVPYSQPATETQWADDELAYLGAPAKSASDPRVTFLDAWETDEATFREGNVDNPLDVMPVWNGSGQPTVTSLSQGLSETTSTMSQAFDAPIRQGLSTPGTSLTELEADLADSNWSGYGQGSANEHEYVYGGGPYGGGIVSDLGSNAAAPQGGSGGTPATLASSSLPYPGGKWDPLNAPSEAMNAVLGAVGKWLLQGVLTLVGGGLIVFGASITTERSGISGPQTGSQGGILAPLSTVAEDAPEVALA